LAKQSLLHLAGWRCYVRDKTDRSIFFAAAIDDSSVVSHGLMEFVCADAGKFGIFFWSAWKNAFVVVSYSQVYRQNEQGMQEN